MATCSIVDTGPSLLIDIVVSMANGELDIAYVSAAAVDKTILGLQVLTYT